MDAQLSLFPELPGRQPTNVLELADEFYDDATPEVLEDFTDWREAYAREVCIPLDGAL